MRRWWLRLATAVAMVTCFYDVAHGQPWVRLTPVECSDGTAAVTTSINVIYAGAASGTLVTGVVGKQIKVFEYLLMSDTAGISVKLQSATIGACGSSPVDLTGTLFQYSAANQTVDSGQLVVPLVLPVSKDLCAHSSGAGTLTGYILSCTQ